MPPEDIPDIDDIAPPLEIPEATDPTMWLVVGAIALILLVIFILSMSRSARMRVSGKDYDARKSALDKLHRLKEGASGTPPARCALIATEALKEYLFNYHDPRSPYSTSAEIIDSLREKGTPDTTLDPLRDLLTRCDALKYARSETDVNDRTPVIEAAIQFIREDRSTNGQSASDGQEPEETKAFASL